jgi:hypothetical protein
VSNCFPDDLLHLLTANLFTMSDPTPTLIKTSELDKWFNIGKNTRVNRLAMLGLTPDRLLKEGRYYFLNQEQLDLFTDFDKYILETGSSDGYPKLKAVYSDNPAIPDSLESGFESQAVEPDDDRTKVPHQAVREAGQLTTTDGDLNVLVGARQSDIFSSVTGEFTGSFTGTLPTYQVENSLAQQLVANAQSRATAMMLAEHALADEYINNPHLLDPDLRAQLDNFQYSKIDPKGLAASLVASAQRQMKAA